MQHLPTRAGGMGVRTARGARSPWPMGIVLAVAITSCSKIETGRLAADHTGDVSAPPIARIAPADRTAACANLPVGGAVGQSIVRAPYLQRVTARDAVVVWTADAAGNASVTIESPDGSNQTIFPAAVDPTASDISEVWSAGSSFRYARQFTAAISGLEPDTTYCYTVCQDGQPITAPTTLRSAPATGTTGRLQFVALGDSGGGGSDQTTLLQQIETIPFDFMIHTGDLAYDNGTLEQFERNFFDVYAPLLAARPIFPTSGNHEYDTADAAAYRQVFVLPENGGPGGIERWYSYDWGDVHFVALDTERSGAQQAAWLETDLTANQLPWTIVYGHKPPHSSGQHGDDPGFNQWFVPILTAHHVQLVLSGHDHDYERFAPIDGVTYIVTGGGGKGVYELGTPKSGSAFADSVIHVLVVTVDGDTLTTRAIDGTGREFDSTVIHRQ